MSKNNVVFIEETHNLGYDRWSSRRVAEPRDPHPTLETQEGEFPSPHPSSLLKQTHTWPPETQEGEFPSPHLPSFLKYLTVRVQSWHLLLNGANCITSDLCKCQAQYSQLPWYVFMFLGLVAWHWNLIDRIIFISVFSEIFTWFTRKKKGFVVKIQIAFKCFYVRICGAEQNNHFESE